MDRVIHRKCILCRKEFIKKAYPRDKGKTFKRSKGYKHKFIIRPKMSYTCSKECSKLYHNAIYWYRSRGRQVKHEATKNKG